MRSILSKIAFCVLSVVLCFSAMAAEKEDVANPAPKVDKIGEDGAPMVLIPAGEFQMGTDPSEIPALVQQYGAEASWFEDETPRHTVYVDAFYMDIYVVTSAQYLKFLDATGRTAWWFYERGYYWRRSSLNMPVAGVYWHDAVAYAKWAGKRLPTEAEWEKAARGGLVGKKYPWGDSAPDGTQCNFADKNADGVGGTIWRNYDVDDGYKDTAPVGSYRANGYGLYDMAGNVWEWCADWYVTEYYVNSPGRNPKGPDAGGFRVLRGGYWTSIARSLRAANRHYYSPTMLNKAISFRCVVGLQD